MISTVFDIQENEEILSLQKQLIALKARLKEQQQMGSSNENHRCEIARLSAALNQQTMEKEAALDEITVLHKQFDSIKAKLSEMQSKISYSESTLKESLEENERLLKQIDNVAIEETQKEEQISLLQRNEEDREKYLLNVLREKQLSEELASNALTAKQEIESQLKIAHHHLAKKVKETALLNDIVESQSLQLQSLNAALFESENNITAHKASLEAKSAEQLALQEKYQRDLQVVETHAHEWEEKYLKVYDKLQEQLLRIQELQRISEKYRRLQGFLSNMTQFFDPSVQGVQKNTPFENEEDNLFERGPRQKAHYQNLFDMPTHSPRFKQNLFE